MASYDSKHSTRKRNGQFTKKSEAERRKRVSEVRKSCASSRSVTEVGLTNSTFDNRFDEDASVQQPVDITWKDGRRIMELDVLSKYMNCRECGHVLQLCDIHEETRYGLASILYIHCECGVMNSVPTGKSHPTSTSNRGVPIYHVNTKAAAGMVHTGMRPTHVSSWLSSLNIPGISERTLKKQEREIGPAIERVAKRSCEKSLQEEIEFQRRITARVDSDGGAIIPEATELVGSYDMGWQRRSSGRTYNSKSGHGSLIGQHTGHVIGYGSRKSTCRTCEIAHAKGQQPTVHDCRYNWSASAKAMESSVCVQLLKDIHNEDHHIKYVVMDDDTTTLAHIRKEYDPDIIKWSDINHAKKSLTNALYSAAKTHKKLTSKVIAYLKKCYSYVLAQNKNDIDRVQRGLRAIVPHIFGDHTECGTWCGFHKYGEAYRYKSLPRGQRLSGDDMREALEHIFEVHALNAERLAPYGSTKCNESSNNKVASKAPKSRHYSSSESFDYRLSAAVSQKNIGHGYLMDVYEEKQLTPGKSMKISANKIERKREQRKRRESGQKFKRRKLELKETRNRFTLGHEIREGTTYKSNVGVLTEDQFDILTIPDPVVLPCVKPVDVQNPCTVITFDLETTSTECNTEICQISAVSGESEFNQYILPEKPISPFASNVTHLTLHEGLLLHRGVPVPTMEKKEALSNFLQWLKTHEQVVLAGHNIKSFDAIHLLRVAEECDLLNAFSEVIIGFIDTLPHFRKVYPDLKCHKQEYLVEHLLEKSYDAHNALEDCKALSELISLNSESLFKHSFSFQWSVSHLQCLQTKRMNLDSYRAVVKDKIISQNMAEKCASSGLKLDHLRLAFRRSGEEGIQSVLSEKSQGKTRVTNRKQVVEKLCNYFEE